MVLLDELPGRINWIFGLRPSSGILETTAFPKLDLFPSSGEGGDIYSVESLRKN
jgi:hypothetical protein